MNMALLKKNTQAAQNYFEAKNAFTTGPMEVADMLKKDENIRVIDVRRQEDFEKEHIPGSVNLPKDRWVTLEGLSKETTNILCCYSQTCHLASKAGEFFASQGYPVMEMEGGFEAWKDYELEIEK